MTDKLEKLGYSWTHVEYWPVPRPHVTAVLLYVRAYVVLFSN